MERDRIFISYRREDSAIHALWIASLLESAFGSGKVFLDTSKIRSGDIWTEVIEENLEKTKVFIILIGDQWLGERDHSEPRILDRGDMVRKEVAYACKTGKAGEEIAILPVIFGESNRPGAAQLPEDLEFLVEIQDIQFDIINYQESIVTLIEAVTNAGIEPVFIDRKYPTPRKSPQELSLEELDAFIDKYPSWKIKERPNGQAKLRRSKELFREYVFENYNDAVHFINTASRKITVMNHHPEMANIYNTVWFWISTWDIGLRISETDIELATYLESLYTIYESVH